MIDFETVHCLLNDFARERQLAPKADKSLVRCLEDNVFWRAIKTKMCNKNKLKMGGFLSNVQLLADLNHDYVQDVKDVHYTTIDCHVYFKEFCLYGSLWDQITKQRETDEPYTEKTILAWLKMAIQALEYIHDAKVVHKRVSSKHFKLFEDSSLKLSGFKFEGGFNSDDVPYPAPEQIKIE